MRTTPVVCEEYTKEQKDELLRQFEVSLKRSELGKDGVQCVLGKGDVLISNTVELLRRLGNPVNPYEKERTKQAWFYPKGWKPGSLEVQAKNLSDALSGFEPKWREDVSGLIVPDTADGICIMPTLIALGKHWGIDSYHAIGECIEAMYAVIAAKRSTTNYRQGGLSNRYVRLPEGWLDVVEPLEREAEKQGYNCLTLPFHFGDWKTGECYSPRNATWQALNQPPARFPFCAVQVGFGLLAMPDRLTAWEQLFIDCCDQYDWCAAGKWAGTLYVSFNLVATKAGIGDELELDARGADFTRDRYGLPVAFLGV